MIRVLDLLCYGLVLLFGIAVSVCFSGSLENRKDIILTGRFFFLELFLQIISLQLFGLEHTKELYPFIAHLPLVIFLTVFLKRTWLVSLYSVSAAYLCCQIPKWIGDVSMIIFETQLAYYLSYIPAISFWFFLLWKYVAAPVRHIITLSKKSCLLFGAIPLLYYMFDYISTIYTDWLYSGSRMAVQFTPSFVSMFYFVFVLVYYAEIQKAMDVRLERDLIAAQLKQAKLEFDTLIKMEEQTRRYRHDMRHHLTLLQGLAANGDMENIINYLQTAQCDLEALTPSRYCKNETVNLLLSYFKAIAKQNGVVLSVEAALPDNLGLSDTELCSLISNSLENAITAAKTISTFEKRTVSINMKVHKEKILLLVKNPYEGDIVMLKGLPQSSQKGHGYGTRSISAIAEFHGGHALFSANKGTFSLKVVIPLK